MMTAHREQHLEDGEFLRAIDEQLEHDESARVLQHLASCDVCARRMQQLHGRQQRLSSLLHDSDFDMPALAPPVHDNVIDIDAERARRREPRTRLPWLRIAAGIVLMLGVALTMTPLQAIVGNWLRAQWSRVVGEEQVTDPSQPEAPTPPGPDITFAHSGATFQLNLAHAQADGTVTVRLTDSADVTAKASRAGVEMLLLPNGLRLVNDPSATGSYEILVPTTVTDVTITVAGRIVARLDAARIAAGAVIPLQ